MRNKLIHCEPDALLRLIQELEPGFRPPPRVKELRFEHGATGAEMLATLQTLKGATYVANTTSRERGFYGWMLEAASNGTFEAASLLLRHGVEVLNQKAK
jgi:hypothetical protein